VVVLLVAVEVVDFGVALGIRDVGDGYQPMNGAAFDSSWRAGEHGFDVADAIYNPAQRLGLPKAANSAVVGNLIRADFGR
jgi:hypothetical protein